MTKLGILLADGCEEIEALTVVDIMRRAKDVEITMVTINDTLRVKGSHGIVFEADKLFCDADFDAMDALVLPGGMPGTVNLKNHRGVQKLIRQFDDEGKYLCAICAAPTILGEAGLLSGYEATCYPGLEGALKGAHIITNVPAASDGPFVTARGMGAAIEFALEILRRLTDNETVYDVRKQIVY